MTTKIQPGTLYQELVAISEEFFGPATDRFLRGQIEHHLHKSPANLTREDIPNLIEWLRLSLTMLHNDQREITRYIVAVRQLQKRQRL